MRRSKRSLYLSVFIAFIAFALMSLLAACSNPSATTSSTPPNFTTISTTPSANSTNASTVTPPTQAPTQAPTTQTSSQVSPSQASQAAQDTVQQYYDDINAQNFQDAYNIWLNNQQTFSQFKQGFSNTSHDLLTLGNSSVNSDGSVQVNISLESFESVSVGVETHATFQGYYIVQQQSDGSWKFTTANLSSN